MKKNILTGDRPSGKLHIGHYFGSLVNRVKLQDEYDQYIMIADVQALTDNFDNPKKVRDSVKELALDYLSVGIDPNKTTIFIQSMIPEIAELTIFYSNLVTISRLQRNPTVKSEIQSKKQLFGENGEGITYGFLGYPVSQAADITAFMADLVPVGDDQLPMIEQTREIVRKFNSIYGETLKEPEALVGEFPRLKGLDGNAKMSKSLNNAIYLSDEDDVIVKKVMSAKTDETKVKKDMPANPKKCMVGYYHEIFSKDEKNVIFDECKKGLRGCVDCKKQLSSNIIKYLKPIKEKRKYYEAREDEVNQILINGIGKAKQKARLTMKKVKENMMIDYFE